MSDIKRWKCIDCGSIDFDTSTGLISIYKIDRTNKYHSSQVACGLEGGRVLEAKMPAGK